MLAIIGGTGLTQLSNLDVTGQRIVRTPYGEASGPVTLGTISKVPVAFLARHGYGHTISPHEVNYRANIWALHHLGVTEIISVASVGGIHDALSPGVIVVPDQIIDYTWGRHATFFETGAPVKHFDFTHPYTETLRNRLIAAAAAVSEKVVTRGTYAATQGPRLETAAEINRYERDGNDIVGMTAMPEAILAREMAVDYAAVCVVVNYAAGRGDAAITIPMEKVPAVLDVGLARVRRIIEKLLTSK